MNASRRRAALAGAALATLFAVAWAANQADTEEDLAAPARGSTAEPVRSEPPPSGLRLADMSAVQRRTAEFSDPKANPFAAKSWKPHVAQTAPAPVAPPLPYSYFGRMTEDGKLFVFLQRGERTYMVAKGDVVDQQYRVDDIAPNAVVITYLPLKQRQVLDIGS